MDVIDHVRATQAQHRPDPEQLRVVEVVQVGSLTRGGAPDPPAHARHVAEPPAGAVNRHDSHAVGTSARSSQTIRPTSLPSPATLLHCLRKIRGSSAACADVR